MDFDLTQKSFEIVIGKVIYQFEIFLKKFFDSEFELPLLVSIKNYFLSRTSLQIIQAIAIHQIESIRNKIICQFGK